MKFWWAAVSTVSTPAYPFKYVVGFVRQRAVYVFYDILNIYYFKQFKCKSKYYFI